MKKITIISLCLLTIGCHGNYVPNIMDKIEYNNISYISSQDIEIESLDLEPITIVPDRKDCYTSLMGDFFILDDKIHFADKSLTAIFTYNLDGEFVNKRNMKGRSSNEVLSLDEATTTSDGKIIIAGRSNDLYMFDRDFNRLHFSVINWNVNNDNIENLYNHPDPNNLAIYEKEYNTGNFAMIGDSLLLFPIVTDHIKYNGFLPDANRDHFYENSYTLGIYNINTKIVRGVFNRSEIYKESRYLPNFKTIQFTLGEDKILYFSFEADPLIYTYSLKTQKIISFGVEGKDMVTDGREVSSLAAAGQQRKKNYGYYTALDYLPETEILFRSYNRGGEHTSAGLQIYKNNRLVAEYNVPINFKIIGYVAPYYYGYGDLESEDGSMTI